MTFEQRVKGNLAEQLWTILGLQQRVEELEKQLAEREPPKAAVSQFPMAVNATTTQ